MSGRRGLLQAAGTAAAAMGMPFEAKAAPPLPEALSDGREDAALLFHCHWFFTEERERREVNEFGRTLADDATEEEDEAFEARLTTGIRRWGSALERVIRYPATTPQGMRAKALALQIAVHEGAIEFNTTTLDEAEPHERLAYSLAADLLRMLPA